jgi:hypothetical protein
VLFQLAHHVGDGRLLLADGHVHALNAGIFWLMIASIAMAVLPV